MKRRQMWLEWRYVIVVERIVGKSGGGDGGGDGGAGDGSSGDGGDGGAHSREKRRKQNPRI